MNTITRSTDQIQCSNDQAGHGGGDSRVGGSWGGDSMGNDSWGYESLVNCQHHPLS